MPWKASVEFENSDIGGILDEAEKCFQSVAVVLLKSHVTGFCEYRLLRELDIMMGK